jgi:glycosyltransferase involved in cell wall biosynthesis
LLPDESVVVMVTRLEDWLKLEGVLRAIDAVEALAATARLRLVIVGEGTARSRVQERADEVNAACGRDLVILTGGLVDPRPAYDAADLMLGMGGSALRSLAFAKPLVVLGERGFSRVLDESTLPLFLRQGWYGLGDGRADDLEGQIRRLIEDPDRADLGKWGRAVVEERFDLDVAADRLVDWYEETVQRRQSLGRDVVEGGRTGAFLVGHSVRDRLRRSGRAQASPTNDKETS